MAKSISDRIAFIEGLELADSAVSEGVKIRTLKEQAPPVSADNKKEAYVVGGSIYAFTENVKGQAKKDIMNAANLAQLAANKKYDRESKSKEWYQVFETVLENIGFIVESFAFNEYDSHGSSFTMDKAVISLLSAIATGSSLQILTAALNSLSKMADSSGQITLFESQSSKGKMGNFQIGACDQSPSGDVSFALGAYYYSTHKSSHHVLFVKWGHSDVNFYQSSTKVVLNSSIYEQVRDKIIKKLGDKANTNIDSIEI